MSPKKIHPLRIRRLSRHEEFRKLLEIQRAVWEHEDADLTPVHQFCVSSKMGAILLGAYAGKELAGFVFSFPAIHQKKLHQHSHLLAILPAYRGLGIGKLLKWAQRKQALKLGYDKITWTFDPLQAKNASLNLHTLGALTRTYLPNFYGEMASALTHGPGIPTDRLLVEWPIKSPRVIERRRGRHDKYDQAKIAKALERKKVREGAFPSRPRLNLKEKTILVETLPNISETGKSSRLVSVWQMSLRKVLSHYFRRGYTADDFLFGDRSFYVLRRGDRT